jgi:hypothetical protein
MMYIILKAVHEQTHHPCSLMELKALPKLYVDIIGNIDHPDEHIDNIPCFHVDIHGINVALAFVRTVPSDYVLPDVHAKKTLTNFGVDVSGLMTARELRKEYDRIISRLAYIANRYAFNGRKDWYNDPNLLNPGKFGELSMVWYRISTWPDLSPVDPDVTIIRNAVLQKNA